MSKVKKQKEKENQAQDARVLKSRILTVDAFFLLTVFHSILKHFWPTSSLYKWTTLPLSVVEIILFLIIIYKRDILSLPSNNPNKGLKLVLGIESAAWVLWAVGGLTGWMNMPRSVGLVFLFAFCGLLLIFIVCQVTCLRDME